MPNNNDLTRRVTRLEQRQKATQQAETGGNGGNYGPASILRFDDMHDALEPGSSDASQDARRVAHIVSQVTAEAQAAHYTAPWHLSIRTAEDGALLVSGPPWWPETPASAPMTAAPYGRHFDAGAALAAIAGIGSRRYA